MEFVDLKKKNKKTDAFVKFKNNSGILDEILESQISPFDTYGLGYKKEGEKYEVGTWSPKTPKAGPSMSKTESKAPPAQHKEDLKKSERHQEVGPTPQSKFRRETIPRWNQSLRYEDGFNG